MNHIYFIRPAEGHRASCINRCLLTNGTVLICVGDSKINKKKMEFLL